MSKFLDKRLTKSKINWKELKKRMPSKIARDLFDITKNTSDRHAQSIKELPGELPWINWEGYFSKVPGSELFRDLRKQYRLVEIPYPTDTDGRFGSALAKDEEIKEVRDEVLAMVARNEWNNERDKTFFRRLPPARSMTMEMYMEAFPNRHMVKPWLRDAHEDELDVVDRKLAVFAKKNIEEKRKKPILPRINFDPASEAGKNPE